LNWSPGLLFQSSPEIPPSISW